MTNEAFLEAVGRAAMDAYDSYEILPSVTTAQAILESGWGRSELAVRANNFFGMKAGKDWEGEVCTMKTQEQTKEGTLITVTADFRSYGSIAEGILGYYEFLQYPRYRNLRGEKRYPEACHLLLRDGWATDQSYAKKLIRLIEKYHLDRFDGEVLSEMVTKEKIIVNGRETLVEMIRKRGTTYVKTRDLAPLVGFEVTNRGRIPVLTEK